MGRSKTDQRHVMAAIAEPGAERAGLRFRAADRREKLFRDDDAHPGEATAEQQGAGPGPKTYAAVVAFSVPTATACAASTRSITASQLQRSATFARPRSPMARAAA